MEGSSVKTITLGMLYAHNACADQIDLFARTFGQSVIVTPDAFAAVADLFDWFWAAQHLLPAYLADEYQRQRAPLWAEYERQQAPLWAEYDRRMAPLRDEYERQQAPLLVKYERQRAPLWAEFECQQAPLWAECERQQARTFATLYLEA